MKKIITLIAISIISLQAFGQPFTSAADIKAEIDKLESRIEHLSQYEVFAPKHISVGNIDFTSYGNLHNRYTLRFSYSDINLSTAQGETIASRLREELKPYESERIKIRIKVEEFRDKFSYGVTQISVSVVDMAKYYELRSIELGVQYNLACSVESGEVTIK